MGSQSDDNCRPCPLGRAACRGRFLHQAHASPDVKPLAAFMIFVIVFSVAFCVVFAALTTLLQALGFAEKLVNPAVAILFLLAVFVPAFLVARWQLRKPPRAPRRL